MTIKTISSFLSHHTPMVAAAFCFSVVAFAGTAQAQPGATPPGSVSPYGPAGPPPPRPIGPPPAQPSAPPPPPPNYYQPAYQPPMELPPEAPKGRQGFLFGFNFGLGSLISDTGQFECRSCIEEPAAVSYGIQVGTMINPNMAIIGEIWGQARAVDDAGATWLNQTMYTAQLKYWFTERLWAKAGIGAASLSLSREGESQALSDGTAILAAIGVELVSTDSFAWDLQLKSGTGIYSTEFGNAASFDATTFSTGLTWY